MVVVPTELEPISQVYRMIALVADGLLLMRAAADYRMLTSLPQTAARIAAVST
jgi:hypothetical protein